MASQVASRRNRVDVHVRQRLRALRHRRGLSQSQLSEKLQVSPAQVIAYEDGVSRIDALRLAEIAGVLDVPISMFFDGLHEDRAEPRARTN